MVFAKAGRALGRVKREANRVDHPAHFEEVRSFASLVNTSDPTLQAPKEILVREGLYVVRFRSNQGAMLSKKVKDLSMGVRQPGGVFALPDGVGNASRDQSLPISMMVAEQVLPCREVLLSVL